ncbi:hypothetical protein QBC46DRAFT_284873 [Diplogelasinospora grovesii]|uniref:Uncharacterized protein n=1 Tax=Diplogelasinospora grovesii TaxID=303347 RepID=A0AAN6S6W8_9PEZI|nr:hypothetical protein QBC46DRAFT_284873 [Diplogelasinospora grovesii]
MMRQTTVLYNEDTGVGFTEWAVSGAPRNDRNWSRESRHHRHQQQQQQRDHPDDVRLHERIHRPFRKNGGVRIGKGPPRSLVDTCVSKIADNIGEISSPEDLRVLPQRLVEEIWNLVVLRKNISLQAWRIFSKLFIAPHSHSDHNWDATVVLPMNLFRYGQQIPDPTAELAVYTTPLSSLGTDFITSLAICRVPGLQTNELIHLASMPNLGILEIEECPDGVSGTVSDYLIRGWSEQENPFPVLRFLRVHHNRALSQHSLQYISAFPALCVYEVSGPWGQWENGPSTANRCGWKGFYKGHGRDYGDYVKSLLDSFKFSLEQQDDKRVLAALDNVMSGLYQNGQQPVSVNMAMSPTQGQDESSSVRGKIWQTLRRTVEEHEHGKREKSKGMDTGSVVVGEDNNKDEMFDNSVAFWTYALTEQLYPAGELGMGDGPKSKATATVGGGGGAALPSKPVASLQLIGPTHGEIYMGMDTFLRDKQLSESLVYSTFVRIPASQQQQHQPSSISAGGGGGGGGVRSQQKRTPPTNNNQSQDARQARPRKRQRMQDVLSSFGM